jgi:hypothetical protein
LLKIKELIAVFYLPYKGKCNACNKTIVFADGEYPEIISKGIKR